MASLPPRHFWRRFGAYAIDIVIFQIVFVLLFLALSVVTSRDLTLPFLQKQQCAETTSGSLIPKIEAEWPLQSGEVRSNQLCRISWLGSEGYTIFVSKVASQHGKTTSVRSVAVPVDKKGDPVDPSVVTRPTSSIVLLLLPVIFAFCSAGTRRTPGKRLLSLRVKTLEDFPLPLGLATKREIFKFLPLMLIAIVDLASLLLARPLSQPIEQLIQQARDLNLLSTSGVFALTGALTPMLFVFALIWWVYPLVVWRGQTFYDRFCDTKVVRD
ncbi:RDD family protein [Rhizobium sp. BR 314]|uniref:RDD family protein n=1 Tax=Rhizobium sp. BR 314 TaxID=3040013 RepID=UPI0039BF09F1